MQKAEILSESPAYGTTKSIGLILGPALFFIILLTSPPTGISEQAWRVVACALLMMTWWITEPLPMPVTSLLPIVLFPAVGVYDIKQAAAPYSNPAVYLYMGGFLLAIAMEKWNLHMRIALNIVRITGTNANGIIAGFMIATATLSMWMSNTATVVMMLPICLSVISLLQRNQDLTSKKGEEYKNFATAMMLGIAYGAGIGGIATIIGTPTNVIFTSYMKEAFGYEVDFMQWMLMGIPFCAVLLGFAWLLLVKVLYPNKLGRLENSAQVIQTELSNLGPLSRGERMVALIFFGTATLWVTRAYINHLFPALQLTDEGIAMISGIILFLTPINLRNGVFVLDWKSAERLPWGILLLFGGGLSLANGLEKTGLVDWIGESISGFGHMAPMVLVFAVTFIAMALTEFMSNMALVTIFLPVVGAMSVAYGVNPLLTTIPVTIAASCAFMLPMSTPPNAIVLAGGHIKIFQMIRAGVSLNIISLVLIMVLAYTLLPALFTIDFTQMPHWAK